MPERELQRDQDAILALASGQGQAAIAVLRLSGSSCHEFVSRFIKPRNAKVPQPNLMVLCDFYDPHTKTVIDEVMCVFFKAPASYTGQDSVEIYLHGSPYITQTVVKLLCENGFRYAEPGEFTRRSYLSGKMDLSKAEGVHELISAQSHQQWLAARYLYSGQIKVVVESLYTEIKEAMAWLEASIDFPEEDDTSHIQRDHILSRVEKIQARLIALLNSYQSGKVASQGFKVILFGEPNVGKSTLMNTLLDSERAIVTEIPGTTRDYIDEPCLIKGRFIRLIDTAGVRKSAEKIEQMGIERTFELVKSADLVLVLAESTADKRSIEKIEKLASKIQAKTVLKVFTKTDLHNKKTEDHWLHISCHSGEGIEDLKNRIAAYVDLAVKPLNDAPFISSARHKAAVDNALQNLSRFFLAAKEGAYDEFLAFELQQTAKQLVSIVGHIDNEDILDVVFSSFCVGK